ncbi:unnamed protein product [Phaeothamnion confervicola]
MKVETGDNLKVKQAMDEAVIRAALDCGYEEDHFWSNFKLILMAAGCAFALCAQFYPMPFPQSRPLLAGCCVSYFVCSGLLQLVMSFFEQDTIMFTKATRGQGKGLRLRTSFPRFQDIFTVIIIEQDKSPGALTTTLEVGVGSFFDQDGYFDEVGFCDRVAEKLKEHEQRVARGAGPGRQKPKGKKYD